VLCKNEFEIDITQFYESLLKLNANSEAAFIAKAAYLKRTDELIDSRECLKQVCLVNVKSSILQTLLLGRNRECFQTSTTINEIQFKGQISTRNKIEIA